MAETPHDQVYEVVAAPQEVVEAPAQATRDRSTLRPLPEDWHDDPVKRLIAMVLADPTPPGVAIALAWFYGRGLPDPSAAPARRAGRDVDAAAFAAVLQCITSDGVDAVRAKIAEAMGEP